MTARLGLAVLFAALSFVPAHAASLSGPALGAALRQGGYVLVVRHTNAPMQAPTRAEAEPGNTGLERQLDAKGRADAQAIGAGLKRLKVRVGRVYSSPAFRALQTVQLAGLTSPMVAEQLSEGGQSMAATAAADVGAWLRSKAAEAPPPGADTVIVTHVPNLRAAFPVQPDVAAGEALVLHPDGKGGAELVGRIKVGDWAGL